jgi:hypothetical protein
MKRDIISEDLQLDRLEKRENETGYSFYIV